MSFLLTWINNVCLHIKHIAILVLVEYDAYNMEKEGFSVIDLFSGLFYCEIDPLSVHISSIYFLQTFNLILNFGLLLKNHNAK